MPIAFDTNVAAAWRTRLTNGYNAIPLMVQTCVQRMTAGTIDWPLYKKWFDPQGNTNPANVQFVRTVFTTLGQWRQSKTLRFFDATGNAIEASAPGVCAYVWLLPAHGLATGVAHVGSGVRIAITQGMVAATWTDRDVGAIICHELVHKLGQECGRNIVDQAPAYGRSNCLTKASTTPAIALTNADNYRCFLKEANNIAWIGEF